jgi:two-component system chemotaxis response regulator CheB
VPAPGLIVIGASAGGVEVVRELAAGLAPDLPAAVCVVLHIAPSSRGLLPEILNRVSRLPASHVPKCETLEAGRIYVAAPNCHLLVRDGTVVSNDGPRENGFRPAVDPLFRSAAEWYGPRVVGVILSGALDDGVAGLAAIKAHGGRAVVQEPDDAMVRGMPESAIRNVKVDCVVPAADMAEVLNTLAAVVAGDRDQPPGGIEQGSDMARRQKELSNPTPSTEIGLYRCPDCAGPMRQVGESPLRFRCHEGHMYSAESLLARQDEQLLGSLHQTVSALREEAALGRRVARHAHDHQDETFARFVLNHVWRVEQRLKMLTEVLAASESGRHLEVG